MTVVDHEPRTTAPETARTAQSRLEDPGKRHRVDVDVAWLSERGRGEFQLNPPPTKFYWARLTSVPRRPSRYALRAAFEAWLPLPVDEVECRFVPLGPTDWAACGIERRALESWIDSATQDGERVLSSISPAAWPAHIGAIPKGAAPPEFRSGAFACQSLKRARLRLAITAAVTAVVLSAIATTGLLSRASALRDAAADIDAQARPAITEALELGAPMPASVDPLRLLESTLRSLRDATDTAATTYRASDAVEPYLEVLAAWPDHIPTRVDRLEVGETSIRITLSVRDHADANRFVNTLTEPELPWTLGSRNIQQSPRPEDGVRVDLLLNRVSREETTP
jgi:hypothetical protein